MESDCPRPATAEDAGAIAYLSYLAGQGHCRVSTYDLMVPGRRGPTAERVYAMRRLVTAGTISWMHFSHYEVAESEGRVVAALGSFKAAGSGNLRLVEALRETGWTDHEVAAMSSDTRVYVRVEPSVPRGAWLLENAATLPEFRGRGYMTMLVESAVERGRKNGCALAQLACHIGNDRARRVYERAGFEVTQALTDPEFEVVFGCPGMWRMTRTEPQDL